MILRLHPCARRKDGKLEIHLVIERNNSADFIRMQTQLYGEVRNVQAPEPLLQFVWLRLTDVYAIQSGTLPSRINKHVD